MRSLSVGIRSICYNKVVGFADLRSPDASTACSSRTTRKHPFQFQKRNSAGEIKNKAKGFLVGRAGVTRPQASGLSLRFITSC